MNVDQIVDAYADEIKNWDFYSDGQRAYIDDNSHIVVCLRNYNWYITKNPIKTELEAIKALFEIDWIAEYDEEDDGEFWISHSDYWVKY